MTSRKLFLFIFFLVLAIKLSTLLKPYLGYFSSYQVVHAMIAQFYLDENFTHPFLPRAHYLINGEPAVILLFFPATALLTALGAKITGLGIDLWGRLVNVIFSTLSILVFLGILKKDVGASFMTPKGAINRAPTDGSVIPFSVLALMLFPIHLIVGQCFVNDNLALFLFLAGFAALAEGKPLTLKRVITAGLLCSLSFLIRIHFVVLAPVLFFQLRGTSRERDGVRGEIWLALIISLTALPMLWSVYVFLEAPQHVSLHTSLLAQAGEERRFAYSPEYFKRLPEILVTLILNPAGVLLTLLGILVSRKEKKFVIWYLWLALGFSIVFLLPQKTADHPFYLFPFLPPAAFFAGEGWNHLKVRAGKATNAPHVVLGVLIGFTFLFSWGPLYRDLPRANEIRMLAAQLKGMSERGEVTAVSDTSDNAILYYANRSGWKVDLRKSADELNAEWEQISRLNPPRWYVAGDVIRLLPHAEGFLASLKQRYRTAWEGDEGFILDL